MAWCFAPIFWGHYPTSPLKYGAFFSAAIPVIHKAGVFKKCPNIQRQKRLGITGLAVMFIGLFVYPAIGNLDGLFYPAAPVFPEPCPLTTFTFGFILTAKGRVSPGYLVIPLIWAVLGVLAALELGVKADFLQAVTGVAGFGAAFYKNRESRRS